MTKKLVGLQSSDYEHPFDKAALEKVSAIPVVPKIVNFMLTWGKIKWDIIQLCGSNFHVTRDSCPELHAMMRDIADTLDVTRLPEMYTQWGYFINAYTTGYDDNTLMVVYTGAVDLMSENETRFIIGHEMGHIKSAHVLYHVMADYLGSIVTGFSLAAPFAAPLQLALSYWNRMSEFTADRAGLLACQDLDAALSSITKMAGIPSKYFATTDHEALLRQADEFETRYGDFMNSAIKNISILDDSHPWTVMRAAELIRWVRSGAYDELLGKYKALECPVCHHHVNNTMDVCPVCGSRL